MPSNVIILKMQENIIGIHSTPDIIDNKLKTTSLATLCARRVVRSRASLINCAVSKFKALHLVCYFVVNMKNKIFTAITIVKFSCLDIIRYMCKPLLVTDSPGTAGTMWSGRESLKFGRFLVEYGKAVRKDFLNFPQRHLKKGNLYLRVYVKEVTGYDWC